MKQLFNWMGVSRADVRDAFAVGVTLGLMIAGAIAGLLISPMRPFFRRKPRDNSESWLFKNKPALESVVRGMKEAEQGKLIDRGSFKDIDEESSLFRG